MGVSRRPGAPGLIIYRDQKLLWYVFYVGIKEGVGS